jgi:hypothetical protein
MTKLNKYLRRELPISRLRRSIIIGIDPETQEISLREKGSRTEYKISIIALYTFLVKQENK